MFKIKRMDTQIGIFIKWNTTQQNKGLSQQWFPGRAKTDLKGMKQEFIILFCLYIFETF